MKYDFDQIINRRNTESMKWTRDPDDVIPMWMSDMDFISPQPVIDALAERAAHGIFGYAAPPPELAGLIIDDMFKRHGWVITAEDLIFIPGVSDGFHHACQVVGAAGDEVLVQAPIYHQFLKAPAKADRIVRPVAMTQDSEGQYPVDLERFEQAISERTSLLLFCNPHNPTGRVYTRTELEGMAEICIRKDVVVSSDEVHCDLVYSGQKHIPIASLDPQIAARTITLVAPSKTYNLAGLKFGVAIIQDVGLRARYQAWLSKFDGIPISVFGNVGAVAAYRHGGEWLDQVLRYLEENRDLLVQFVNQELPGIKMAVPQATYLAWIDCRDAGLAQIPAEFFMDRARVSLDAGEQFGPGGDGFVRLNFACPRPVLLEALNRMKTALNDFIS
jgi:cysteine-S-conjugate beta-lyase